MALDYFFSRQKTDEQPHIYYYTDQQPPYEIKISLPALSAESIPAANEAFFKLEALSETTSQVVIDAGIWDFSDAASPRTDVQTAYQEFLLNLDNAGLSAGSINLIKMRLAEVMPLTFAEVLYYHYGFDPIEGWIDLQAGMQLRVDYQTYQLVHPAEEQSLQGYVGSGTSFYQVITTLYRDNDGGSDLMLGFDPFVTDIQQTVSDTGPNNGGGGAGIIDMKNPAYRRPFFRLFYPPAVPDVSSAGWAGTEENITLVGADSWTDLTTATTEYTDEGSVSSIGKQAFYFRGRTLVIPEIAIFINDQPEYVAVGTTVRQLVERYCSAPPAGVDHQDLSEFSHGRQLYRLLHLGPNSTPTYRPLHFEYYQTYDDGTDVFDIPVLKGDKLYITA